jgi:branched-chain amino acid aminotransferase
MTFVNIQPSARRIAACQDPNPGFARHYADHMYIAELYHLMRLNASAQRIGIPRVDAQRMCKTISALLQNDAEWIDREARHSLYIRPLLYCDEPCIGVREDNHQFKCVIFSTLNAARQNRALRLYVPRKSHNGKSREFSRAFQGGTGNVKASANYAGTLLPLRIACDHGCDDVLWLDAATGTLIEEAGTSNVFFQIGDKVITPRLDGTILPGITRSSIISLLQSMGIPVEERPITLSELQKAGDRLQQAFTTGTASSIRPIEVIDCEEGLIQLPKVDNSLAAQLKARLQAIQWGEAEDTMGWMYTTD